jgi:hypothetical protein
MPGSQAVPSATISESPPAGLMPEFSRNLEKLNRLGNETVLLRNQ